MTHRADSLSLVRWPAALPIKPGAPAPLPSSCPWNFSPARAPALPETAHGFRGSTREVSVRGNLSLVFGVLLLLSAATPALHASELRIERLFGPEIKTGPYKHPARIEALQNGDLYVVYYGGEGEYAIDTGVFGSRLKEGSRKWTTPTRIAHDPFRSLGNGVVWQAP